VKISDEKGLRKKMKKKLSKRVAYNRRT